MSAYVIAHIEVNDAETFDAYREKVPAVIEKFGGRYLVRGGTVHGLEGQWTIPRLVIIAFDSLEAAQRFYHSPEYQEILPLRLQAAEGTVVIAEGV